jgi:hypothetical protein
MRVGQIIAPNRPPVRTAARTRRRFFPAGAHVAARAGSRSQDPSLHAHPAAGEPVSRSPRRPPRCADSAAAAQPSARSAGDRTRRRWRPVRLRCCGRHRLSRLRCLPATDRAQTVPCARRGRPSEGGSTSAGARRRSWRLGERAVEHMQRQRRREERDALTRGAEAPWAVMQRRPPTVLLDRQPAARAVEVRQGGISMSVDKTGDPSATSTVRRAASLRWRADPRSRLLRKREPFVHRGFPSQRASQHPPSVP